MNNVGKGQDRIKDLLATKVPNSVSFQSWITNYRPTTLSRDRCFPDAPVYILVFRSNPVFRNLVGTLTVWATRTSSFLGDRTN